MSETEPETQPEQPATEPQPDEDFPPGGPITSPDGDDATNPDGNPDEAQYEASAEQERERELAAARQEDEQSLEAQKREQDAKRKKLDQLAAHVAKRYGEILGDDLDGFMGCPMCAPWYPGIRLPVMPDPEVVAQIKVAIGEDPDPPLNPDNYSRVCDTCGGHGKVLTGSHVPGQKSALCFDCDGRGWIPVGSERETGAVTVTNGHTGLPAPILQDNPSNDPPEVERLKQLGYVVVAPIQPVEAQ